MPNAYRSPKIPAAVRQLFGKPPIMAGEDPAEYEHLIELVRADVKPQDLQEWLLARDIADAEWELLRLRGMKLGMLHAMIPRAMNSLITDAQGTFKVEVELVAQVRKLLVGVVAGDEQAKQDLEQLLEGFGLSLDVVTAATFGETIRSQVHTNRMVAAAYERRNAAYAELERRRAKQEKAATAASDDDDSMQEVEAPPTGERTLPADRADQSVNAKAG
jgi:hypothetical protein